MILSRFIEEAASQEGWGMDFASVIEGAASEADWTVGFVFEQLLPLEKNRRTMQNAFKNKRSTGIHCR
jgi:hypothetical protein